MTLLNTEEYENPVLYDKENEAWKSESTLLLRWAKRQQGTIIDLACGTGRMTIPLAQAGFNVIGVDYHQAMLKQAEDKATQLNLKLTWLEQDCTKLDLPFKARLIYSIGNSFQHFLTNDQQDGFLASAHTHLEQGGVLIFGARFPAADELLQPSEEEYWRSYEDNGLQVNLFTISNYDSIKQIQHYVTIRRYQNAKGEIVAETKTNIQLRYTYPQEMERLLEKHGFTVLHRYKDWTETPLDGDSAEMIFICQK